MVRARSLTCAVRDPMAGLSARRASLAWIVSQVRHDHEGDCRRVTVRGLTESTRRSAHTIYDGHTRAGGEKMPSQSARETMRGAVALRRNTRLGAASREIRAVRQNPESQGWSWDQSGGRPAETRKGIKPNNGRNKSPTRKDSMIKPLVIRPHRYSTKGRNSFHQPIILAKRRQRHSILAQRHQKAINLYRHLSTCVQVS